MPEGHGFGSLGASLDVPGSQKCPDGQFSYGFASFALSASQTMPAGHGSHTTCPIASAYSPFLHGCGDSEPLGQCFDTGHSVIGEVHVIATKRSSVEQVE